MPNFVFECKECNLVYEDLTSWDKTGKYAKVVCPKCGYYMGRNVVEMSDQAQ